MALFVCTTWICFLGFLVAEKWLRREYYLTLCARQTWKAIFSFMECLILIYLPPALPLPMLSSFFELTVQIKRIPCTGVDTLLRKHSWVLAWLTVLFCHGLMMMHACCDAESSKSPLEIFIFDMHRITFSKVCPALRLVSWGVGKMRPRVILGCKLFQNIRSQHGHIMIIRRPVESYFLFFFQEKV